MKGYIQLGMSPDMEGLVQKIMLRISSGKFKSVDFDMNILHSKNRGMVMF